MWFTRLILILLGFWLLRMVWRSFGLQRKADDPPEVERGGDASGRRGVRGFGRESIEDGEFEEIEDRDADGR